MTTINNIEQKRKNIPRRETREQQQQNRYEVCIYDKQIVLERRKRFRLSICVSLLSWIEFISMSSKFRTKKEELQIELEETTRI